MVKEPIKLTEEEKRNRTELAFEWVARYKDGTELKQYDDSKQLVNHFGHIDQDKIYEFELVPKRNGLFPVTVNLETGLFFIDGKKFTEVFQGETRIPLGLFLSDKKVTSSWGNKAKLICFRHVRRDFVPGPEGFYMKASVVFEIGWEATVDGKHEEFKLLIDEDGKLGIPQSFEEQGFKRL
jgi:hypothetical protein